MPIRLSILSPIGWGLIIGVVVAAMWIPSSIMSTEAVVDAREDQMVASLSMVREQVLGFFQTGSRAVHMLQQMYAVAMAKDPTRPTQVMMEVNREAMWHFVGQNPTVSMLFASNMRRPEGMGHPTCDLNIAVFASNVYINVYEGMSGVLGKYDEECKNPSSLYPCGNDTFRVLHAKGASDPADPSGPGEKYADIPCRRGVPSTLITWYPAASSLTSATYHGVTKPSWDRSSRLQGNKAKRASALRVTGPVEGPSWAPQSGLVGAQLRVSEPVIESDTTRTLNDIIEEAVAKVELPMTIALLTSELEIIGNSLGIPNSRRDADGVIDGFLAADNASALPSHIASVARHLRKEHCVSNELDLAPWERRCRWEGVPELQHLDGHTVVALPVEDEYADGLGMLMVCIVRDSRIREPAEKLNLRLSIISPIVLVLGCVVAFIFSYAISKPITVFCASLQVAADMQELESFLLTERKHTSCITEIGLMHQSLSHLVQALLEYKSYLPSSMFKDEPLKDSGEFQGVVVQGTKSQDSCSAGSIASSATTTATAYLANDEEGKVGRTVRVLRKRRCVVMAINLVSWTKHVLESGPETVLKEINGYVGMVKEAVRRKGSIDRFNGDQMLVSWNTWHDVASYRKVACQAAHDIRAATVAQDWLKCPLGIGIAAGTVLSGNAGISTIRAFNVIGVPVVHAFALSNLASEHCSKVLVLVSDQVAEAGLPFVTCTAGSLVIKKLARQNISYRKVFAELLDPLDNSDEWMYTVGEQAMSQCATLFSSVIKDNSHYTNIAHDLYRSILAIRSNMIFADKGWSNVVLGIEQGSEDSIFFTA